MRKGPGYTLVSFQTHLAIQAAVVVPIVGCRRDIMTEAIVCQYWDRYFIMEKAEQQQPVASLAVRGTVGMHWLGRCDI